jgi:hypothetical protein
MAKKVICTNPGRCYQCFGGDQYLAGLVRGRAYTVLAEESVGERFGYKLAEAPLPPNYWHCAPHFQEIIAADTDIFTLTDVPVTEDA